MKRYNKEQLLEVSNGGEDVYLAYLDLESDGNGGYKHTLNPCYDDTKPSLMVKYDEEAGRFRHCDYGGSSDGKVYKGDCFNFIAQLMDLDIEKNFGKIMEIIAEKLGIELQVEHEINDYNALSLYGYELDLADDRELLEFFKPYGVTQDILRQYNVRNVKGYKQLKDGKVECKKMFNLVIGFEQAKFVKLYCPNPKHFWYLGCKDKNFLFGKAQIERRVRKSKSKQFPDTIILTGGQKDVLTLTALGLDAVALNSETAGIASSTLEFLTDFNRVMVLYDNDKTGKKNAQKLVNEFQGQLNIYNYQLPEELKEKGGKDVSDYVKLGLSKEKLLEGIEKVGKGPIVKSLNGSTNLENVKRASSDIQNLSNVPKIDKSYLSENIFQHLPEVLKVATEEFTDRREKDLILLSCLGVLSSLFPTVKGIYSGMKVGCNLFLFFSAPAASGKGAINWARLLGAKIQEHLDERYNCAFKAYQSELIEYKKAKRNDSTLLAPEVPLRQNLFMSGNSSVSGIINTLAANKSFGILFESEADILANTLNSEWGDFSSVLRCAFHHEKISKDRVADNGSVRADKPHLSVVLSGTPSQVNNLIGSVENGFFSRFMFYDFESEPKWVNQFLGKDNSREQLFELIGEYFAEVWSKHEGRKETIVYLSEKQIGKLNTYFDRNLLELLGWHGDDIVASVKRAGLVCYRITILLAILRHLESNDTDILPNEIEANDQEFDIALSIMDTILYNLERIYIRMQNTFVTNKMNRQQKLLFEALPDKYSKEEFNTILVSLEYNVKTGEKYLKDFQKMKVIERIKHGVYQKVA